MEFYEVTTPLSGVNSQLQGYSQGLNGQIDGNYVRNGRSPKWFRVGYGVYSLFIENGNDFELEAEEVLFKDNPVDEGPIETFVDDETPTEVIINHIALSLFQKYFRRQGTNHPEIPARGWNEILNHYFWPSLDKGWTENEVIINNLIDEANNADVSMDLFKKICRWGGVKVPVVSEEQLENIVKQTLTDLHRKQIPSSPLNSAWTKLYSILLPDKFAIYDSRVANAILSVFDHYPEVIDNWEYNEIGMIAGRGGTRTKKKYKLNWPNGYQQWKAQIQVNKLLCSVRDSLNSEKHQSNPLTGNGRMWTLREVEAVLFMVGY